MSVEALISLAFCTFHWNTRKVISSKKNCTFDFVFWRYCSLSDYLNVNGLSLTNARKEWNRHAKQRELIAEKQKLWRTYIGLKWSDLCASDRNLRRVVSFSWMGIPTFRCTANPLFPKFVWSRWENTVTPFLVSLSIYDVWVAKRTRPTLNSPSLYSHIFQQNHIINEMSGRQDASPPSPRDVKIIALEAELEEYKKRESKTNQVLNELTRRSRDLENEVCF